MSRSLIGVGILGALAGCGGRLEEAAPRKPLNVVLICLDTVRADHVGAYGYDARPTTPAIDALAARSTVFEDASSGAGWTKPSVPTYLTGTWPLQHGVYDGSSSDESGVVSHILPESSTTIAEVLSAADYATAAFVQNAQLRAGQGFEQGFDVYEEGVGDARAIRWRARDWLEERPAGKPFFLYMHILDAHWPYHIPDEAAARFSGSEAVQRFRAADWRALRDGINDGSSPMGPEEIASLVALYDGAIAYADSELGRLFAHLERAGRMDDTVVCVISDHGEEFLEHGRIGHGHGLYEALLHVPWIVYVPGRAPARQAHPVSLVDLLPTLVSAAGVRDPGGHMGIDRLTNPDAQQAIFAEHLEPGSYLQAWRVDQAKYTRKFSKADHGVVPTAVPEQFAQGRRLEVRFDSGSASGLEAQRIKPDDDDETRTELKGVLTSGGAESWTIAGIEVVVRPTTEIYGVVTNAAGEARGLQAGVLAKAVGTTDDAGRLVADKIKLYEDGAAAETELRGPFQGIPEEGRWRIGGLAVEVPAGARIEGLASRNPRMTRERVLEVLAVDVDADTAVPPAHEAALFDLARDPAELEPTVIEPLDPRLRSIAIGFLRSALTFRSYGAGDVRRVDRVELDALKAIGYGN